MNRPKGNKHRRALVGALKRQATAAVEIIAPDTPSNQAHAASVWRERAEERAEVAETVSNETDVPLGPEPAATTLAQHWLNRIVEEVHVGRDSEKKLRTLLEICLPEAERLISAQLDALTQPHSHTDVLECVNSLGEALGENTKGCNVQRKRLRALSLLPTATWTRLEQAPTWAVVLALGNEKLQDADYNASIESLARDPLQWAMPQIAETAQERKVALNEDLDPTRIQAVLENWPWPQAAPPLEVVAACADAGKTVLTPEEWGGALMLVNTNRNGGREQLIPADFVQKLPEFSVTIRTILNESIEGMAARTYREFLLDSATLREQCKGPRAWMVAEQCKGFSPRVKNVPFYDAMERMDEIWASEPLLAPECKRHELHWACASVDNSGDSFAGYKIVLRALHTAPERALASIGQHGNGNWERFPEWIASYEGAQIDAGFPIVGDMSPMETLGTMSYLKREPSEEEFKRRYLAAEEMVKQVMT